jgi:hypothetical protein
MWFAGKWMELQTIMLNKIRENQKDNYHIFSHMQNLDFFKKRWEEEGDQWEGNGGEYDQSTLYLCMKI